MCVPYGFTARTARADVTLATSDLSASAIFVFHAGARRSLSHLHHLSLGLRGAYGEGQIDEVKKKQVVDYLNAELEWVKSKPSGSPLRVFIYFDLNTENLNGQAWTIVSRVIERQFPALSKKNKAVQVITAPNRLPKKKHGWLTFDSEGEKMSKDATEASRQQVQPYYSLLCCFDVFSFINKDGTNPSPLCVF